MQDIKNLARQLSTCSDDERVELLSSIQLKETQLRILNEFAVSMIKIASQDDLVWYVAKEVVGRLGFVDCVLYGLDEDRNVLVQMAAIGDKNPHDRTIVNRLEIPVGIGVTGRVAKSREPALIADLELDDDYVPDISPARSELCVPLMNGNELMGVIDCEDPRPNHFTSEHLETLNSVAALTSSKMAELRAVKKIQDQSQMLERVREAVTIVDTEGRIIDCNEAATRIYGYERSAAIGRSVGDFYPDKKKWQALRKDQLAHIEQFGSWRGNVEVVKGDGSILTMDISITPLLDEDENQTATIAVARDITQLVASEKAIWEKNQALQSKQLELEAALAEGDMARRANLAKDAFLANTSHELRTPLTGVIGIIDLLKKTSLDADQRDLVTAADTSAHSLLSIIDDVLDLAKVEAGKVELVKRAFNPAETVRSIVEALRPSAEQKGLTVISTMPEQLEFDLLGDASRIRQILFNIMGNAVKFTEQGEIAVTVDVVRKGDTASLCVCVRDTGIGFAEEEAQKLFDRFEQLDSSATKNAGGTGLGLAISSELAGLMGGRLTAKGEPGVGATFRFEVELEIAAPTPASDQASGSKFLAQSRPLKFLVAEDNPVNQLLIRKLLAPFPWQVTVVGNGKEVLARLNDGETFDGIFMDIRMPVMDGVQATEEIRKSDTNYADIPILALTANTMEADRKRYREVGINAVVGKPINMQTLLETVDRHVVHDDAP